MGRLHPRPTPRHRYELSNTSLVLLQKDAYNYCLCSIVICGDSTDPVALQYGPGSHADMIGAMHLVPLAECSRVRRRGARHTRRCRCHPGAVWPRLQSDQTPEIARLQGGRTRTRRGRCMPTGRCRTGKRCVGARAGGPAGADHAAAGALEGADAPCTYLAVSLIVQYLLSKHSWCTCGGGFN